MTDIGSAASRPAFTIGPLESASEIDAILAIERASFTNPWTREMYLAELNNQEVAHVFLARTEERQIVGFCAFWHLVDEIHINNLAVDPHARRVGVASALLTRVLAEGWKLGARRAVLEVRRSNEIARQLYEKFGFRLAGVRRGYYSHPTEDALVLTCEISRRS